MSDHARLSPSASYRWIACPASVRECDALPKRPSGKSAIDGTHTHFLLEKCIKDGKLAMAFIGDTLTDHEGSFMVDPERAGRVDFALDYIQGRVDEIGIATVISEERVNPECFMGRDDMSGTCDVQIIGMTSIDIVDYKDGMNAVEAKDNTQLLQYAAGVFAERDPEFSRFQAIRLTIIQPKARLTGSSGISHWDIHPDGLKAYIEMFKLAAEATDDPNSPHVPGEKQCTYCPAKGTCMALIGQTLEQAGIAFENLAEGAAEKKVDEMTDDMLRELVEAAPLIRQMLDGAEAEALRRFEAGQAVAGLKVVRGRGSRSWALDDDQMADKLKRMGMPKSILYKTSLITVAQAQKVKWEKRDGSVVQLTKRQLDTLEKEFVAHGEGRLIVVSEADSRPGVVVAPEATFSPVLPSWLN